MNDQLSDQREQSARLSKKSVIAITIFVLIVSSFCISFFPYWTEPRYQGKRISYWIYQLGQKQLYSPAPERHLVPFHHLGTNSLPYLCKAIEARQSFLGEVHKKIWTSLPPGIRARIGWTPWDMDVFRKGVLSAIAVFGSEAAMAVPALTNALRGPNAIDACITLEKIGPKASNAIPILVQIATGKNPSSPGTDRPAALRALNQIDSEGTQVEKLLIEMLGDQDITWKMIALDCFLIRGRFPPSLLPTLLQALEPSDNHSEQALILHILAESNTPFESVQEALLRHAESPNAFLRAGALRALGALGPTNSSTRQTLLSNLNHDVARIRGQAAQSLAYASEQPIPEVLALLTDPVAEVGIRAAEAAWRWRSPASDEISRILAESLLERETTVIRGRIDKQAFALIKKMGPEAALVAPPSFRYYSRKRSERLFPAARSA